MPGNQPSCMACRVSENAPVMMAWLAMMVAIVARTTRGMIAHCGASLKNGLPVEHRIFEQQRGLSGVAEQQGGQHDDIPGDAYRIAAEMAHVGIERLAAGDGEEHAAEHDETLPSVLRQKADGVPRIDGAGHFGPSRNGQ